MECAPRWFPAQASPVMFPWSFVSSDRARHHFSCCSWMGTTRWPSWRSESGGCRPKKQPLSPKCGPHLQAPVAAHKPAIVWAKSSHRVSPLLVSRRKQCSKENQAMCCTWTCPLCQEVLYAGFSGAPEKFKGAGDRLLPTVPKTVSHQRFNIHVATDAIPSDQMAWKCPRACRSLKVAERANLSLQNTSACITQRLPWRPGRPKCANPGCSGSKIPPFPNALKVTSRSPLLFGHAAVLVRWASGQLGGYGGSVGKSTNKGLGCSQVRTLPKQQARLHRQWLALQHRIPMNGEVLWPQLSPVGQRSSWGWRRRAASTTAYCSD